MELREKLTALRKEKGLSQAELAKRLRVSRQSVSKWENGAAIPTTENLRYLSELYGVSLECLFGDVPLAPKYPEAAGEKPEQAAPPKRFAGKKWAVLAACLLLALAILVGMYLGAKQSDARNPIGEMKSKEVEIDPDQSFSIEVIEPEGR